jgi:hypothetical protein
MASTVPQPGDVLAVRTNGLAARTIRFGAAFRELLTGTSAPNLDNHIAIVHHKDKAGTLWCVEGRPGGVGWRDAKAYLRSPYTVTNVRQPKTADQRKLVCAGALALIGTPYDWEGIAADAAADLDLGTLWHPAFGAEVPGHVVCSSLAEWLYLKARLDCPKQEGAREIQPADWTAFMLANHYSA